MTSNLRRITALAILTFSFAAHSSPLGDLAASMSPGEWRELPTSGLSNAIDDNGSSQHILTFSQGGRTWHSASRQLLFIGGDHNGGNERLIRYDDATNTWSALPDPPYFPGGTTQNHSYRYNSIDDQGGRYFYQDYYLDIASGNWLNTPSISPAGRGHRAWQFFEGLGHVAANDGEVQLWRNGSQSWTTLATGLSWTGLHANGAYSPTRNVMIFGGGDGSDQLYMLAADESITPLGPTPVDTISTNNNASGDGGGLLTHDPVSGKFLFLDHNHQFYELEIAPDGTDFWSQLPSVSFISNTDVDDCVFFPVSTYGVVILVEWIRPGISKMWVYKHGDAGPQPNNPTELSAF